MFENVIGHQELISGLAHEVQSGQLPSSMLFHGPKNGAKLTTALELARVLTCIQRGDWNCSCPACDHHRSLTHPNTLMIGNRSFTNEIAASADVLIRTRKKSSQYLFLRSVRKLLRKFDPVLFEGNEPRFRKVYPSAEKLEDLLSRLSPNRVLPERDELIKVTEAIIGLCEKIDDGSLNGSVSVSQIRRIGAWVHTSSGEPAKVVIVDGAEDLSESTRNALLKMLEEPPENVYYILLSERRGAIIPTIVSRLRPYRFAARDQSDVMEVLRRIFSEDSGEYSSIDEYFMAWSFPDLLRTDARRFLQALQSRTALTDDPDLIDDLSKVVSAKKAFRPFLYELSRMLHEALRSGDTKNDIRELSMIEVWTRIIHEALDAAERYNQSASLLFEAMYYQMRAVG